MPSCRSPLPRRFGLSSRGNAVACSVRISEFASPATGLATYPDVTVICGPLERDEESRETILNPTVLVEVLSGGTERYDRGEKFRHYKQIPTLQEYVLLSQKETLVEVWRRKGDAWTQQEAKAGERLEIESIDCELVTDELYQGVFDE